MPRIVAIIPARGGSKGIPRKNLIELCGKPLVAWSIEQASRVSAIDSVWVSSDSDAILDVAAAHGARVVRRPATISGDAATSESAWLHALEAAERERGPVDLVVGMQPTSPIREPSDLAGAIEVFQRDRLDSLFSSCEIEDFFIWERRADGALDGVNHDWRNRRRRQEIQQRYLENGSFYIFTSELLRRTGNRLGGRIGTFPMARHKMVQIDSLPDVAHCAAIMRAYGIAGDAAR
jgi:CMP-N,N'-diacetyllegionaminic acid synthase